MFLLLIVVFFWGLSWYAIALQLGDIHPLVSIAWRFFIAGAVLCAWLLVRDEFKWPKRTEVVRVCALGLFLFCANFTSFYFATGYITSGLISVVFASAVFITVLNQWVWARVVPARKTLVGAVFGITGIALLFAPSIQTNLSAGNSGPLIGLALSILGTWFFSVGNLVSASLSSARAHLPSVVACAMLFGSLICAITALALGESLALPWDITYLAALVYLAIGASVIAFVAYLTLVKREGADKAGYATVLFPIVALAVSTFLEGYTWSVMGILGVTLATLGALIVFYPVQGSAVDRQNR